MTKLQDMIGVNKVALVNGDKVAVVDYDGIEIRGDDLYTQKSQYQILSRHSLPMGSMKYVITENLKGGSSNIHQHTIDVAKLGGVGEFLTNDQDYDKQLLKFTTKEFKYKHNLNNIDNARLEYNYSDEQIQEMMNDTEQDLKFLYSEYLGRGGARKITKEKNKRSKRYFGVDFDVFEKYRNQVIAANLYVDEENANDGLHGGAHSILGGSVADGEIRLKAQLYGQDGGCDCLLDNVYAQNKIGYLSFQPDLKGGNDDNLDDFGNFIDNSVKQMFKGGNSGILESTINTLQAKYNLLGGKKRRKSKKQAMDEQPAMPIPVAQPEPVQPEPAPQPVPEPVVPTPAPQQFVEQTSPLMGGDNDGVIETGEFDSGKKDEMSYSETSDSGQSESDVVDSEEERYEFLM